MLKRNENVSFDLLNYFEGSTAADGVFEDRFGRTKRRFAIQLTGQIADDGLRLHEQFLFDDGERQARTWALMRNDDLSFTGSCEDTVSIAKGRFDMGKAYLTSDMRLSIGGRTLVLRFEDVFYRTADGTMLNRSTVSKWGITIGQVLVLFRKT